MKGCCGLGPLNGVGANTGNGLLHLNDKQCVKYVKPFIGSYCDCKKKSVNHNITPSEGSRIDSIQYGCNGTSTGVSQARVKELLGRGLRFGNEGTRIARLQEMTVAASESLLNRPIILTQCPPLPPPPAPPARACILTKNQK
jgi:hypothetical protein